MCPSGNRRARSHRRRTRAVMEQATTVEQLLRLPSPAPRPQALASDGEHLWMGSWETQRVYGIDPRHFTVFEESNAPGKTVGGVVVGDELYFVCSEGDDDRFIRRYVPGHGFKEKRVPCPENTGSFLAFDGNSLWLSQRYNKRVLQLDGEYHPVRTIEVGAEVIGIVFVEGLLYAATYFGKDSDRKIARISGGVEYLANLPAGAISLAHDGGRFWTNIPSENVLVAFTL